VKCEPAMPPSANRRRKLTPGSNPFAASQLRAWRQRNSHRDGVYIARR
jgi:hypothetical protein